MSQQDNFSSGFLLGAILGGIAGGALGTILANRRPEPESLLDEPPKAAKRPLRVAGKSAAETPSDIESARHSLEDKIAQLNDAIDDVRHQLNGVNGRSVERTLSED
jgi:hypothetical protein